MKYRGYHISRWLFHDQTCQDTLNNFVNKFVDKNETLDDQEWGTQDGRTMRFDEMTDKHVMNCILFHLALIDKEQTSERTLGSIALQSCWIKAMMHEMHRDWRIYKGVWTLD
jgi:hypothetical protein